MLFSLRAYECTNNTRIFNHALPWDLVRRADDISSCLQIDDGPALCCPLKASCTYRVSQEERTKLRESVPYVKVYRYNPKHLYPKLNSYGDNGQRKVWTSCISAYCTSTTVWRIELEIAMRYAFL